MRLIFAILCTLIPHILIAHTYYLFIDQSFAQEFTSQPQIKQIQPKRFIPDHLPPTQSTLQPYYKIFALLATVGISCYFAARIKQCIQTVVKYSLTSLATSCVPYLSQLSS